MLLKYEIYDRGCTINYNIAPALECMCRSTYVGNVLTLHREFVGGNLGWMGFVCDWARRLYSLGILKDDRGRKIRRLLFRNRWNLVTTIILLQKILLTTKNTCNKFLIFILSNLEFF